jgi:hypothetical protein
VTISPPLCVSGLATDNESKPDEARRLLAQVGPGSATDWLYLSYVTWAGRIDSVYGVGAEFGSVSGVTSTRHGRHTWN